MYSFFHNLPQALHIQGLADNPGQAVVFRFFFLPVMPCHRQGIPALLLPQAIEELTAELVVVKEAVDVRAPGQAVFPGLRRPGFGRAGQRGR